MASYPPSNDPNASTFNSLNYVADIQGGLTYQEALKDFVSFPTTQASLITFPTSINVGGQVECNSVLAQGTAPQMKIKPTGISDTDAPILSYQPAVVGGVLNGLLSSEYIYTPAMTSTNIGTTNPNVLITKGYADATYNAGIGTYAVLTGGTPSVPQTFSGTNKFTNTTTTFNGANDKPSVTISSNPQTTPNANPSFINIVTDGRAEVNNGIVQSGDASIFSFIDASGGGVGSGSLVLTTFNGTKYPSGIRVFGGGVQLSGSITGYTPSNTANSQPLVLQSGKTTTNNQIVNFKSFADDNTDLFIASDCSASYNSSLTQAGDIVMTATKQQELDVVYSETNTNNFLAQVSRGYIKCLNKNITGALPYCIPNNVFRFTIGATNYEWVISGVLSYPNDFYITGSYGINIPPDNTTIPSFTITSPTTATTTAGSVVLCSYNGSAMRIDPTTISFNKIPTCPTAPLNTNNTSIATTEFVVGYVQSLNNNTSFTYTLPISTYVSYYRVIFTPNVSGATGVTTLSINGSMSINMTDASNTSNSSVNTISINASATFTFGGSTTPVNVPISGNYQSNSLTTFPTISTIAFGPYPSATPQQFYLGYSYKYPTKYYNTTSTTPLSVTYQLTSTSNISYEVTAIQAVVN
jgi:hypothetical protein